MSGFIDEADRNQGTLLPERVEEYVSEENPVRVIDAFIGELDLADLGFEGMEPKPRAGLVIIPQRYLRFISTDT